MVPVKANYKNQYKDDLTCLLCNTGSEESQEHIINCPELLNSIEVDKSIKYEDIFDTLDKQVRAVQYISKIMKVREIKLNTSHVRSHVHS